jgi:hypothetical protein
METLLLDHIRLLHIEAGVDEIHGNDRRSVVAAVARNIGMCASGDTQPTLSVSTDKTILSVRGIVIGAISQLDTTILIGDENAKLDHDTKAGLARIALRSKTSFESYMAFAEAVNKFLEGYEREEQLWRTLGCDMTTQIPARRAPAEHPKGWKLLGKQHQATKADGSMDWTGIDMSDFFTSDNNLNYIALMNTIGVRSAGRNLCLTAGGYLGHVPSGSQIGDKVIGGC